MTVDVETQGTQVIISLLLVALLLQVFAVAAIYIGLRVLALLWQIYSRRRSVHIHFRQCGHRCGGNRAKSSTIAWRTAGKVG